MNSLEKGYKYDQVVTTGLHVDWLETLIEYREYRYDTVAVKPDGRIYLVDEEAYSILHDATGEMTANELIFNLILEGVEYIKKTQGSNHGFVKIIEQGDYKNKIISIWKKSQPLRSKEIHE